MTFPKYKQNLHQEGDKIISYTTHVATIEGGKLFVLGWWSVTTSKHVNYVANYYGLEKVESKIESKVDDEFDNMIAQIAMLGNIFGSTQKESNDWKARMLKAGLENKGLIMPDDWNELSEDVKEERLNAVISELNK